VSEAEVRVQIYGDDAAVSVELTRPDGTTVRLDAKNVRALRHGEVGVLAGQVASLLAANPAGSVPAPERPAEAGRTDPGSAPAP
jgi:hypothetical protein